MYICNVINLNILVMINEIWRDIEGYNGLYQISNLGRVKSLEKKCLSKNGKYRINKEKILKLYTNSKDGYIRVGLWKNNKHHSFTLHKIVAQTFIDNYDNKPCIDHINGDRTDNRVENLRWVTHKENNNNPITKKRHSTNHPKVFLGIFGKNNPSSIPVLQFTIDGKLVRKWDCIRDIQRELGIDNTNISRCCRGKQKTAGNFRWCYAVINGFTIDISKLKKVA